MPVPNFTLQLPAPSLAHNPHALGLMSYLANSTHFNNWILAAEELARVRRLQHVKAKRALLLEREEAQKTSASGSSVPRKPRSFAALVPRSSTAVRDAFDWNDEID
ncbi:hypothetical protein BBJ28_00020556, partial [Nothophytophthora sp. Chile5]